MSLDKDDSRFSDDDDGADDFDSCSETSEAFQCQQQTFAVNEALVASLHESPGKSCRRLSSPEWNEDSDSDCWSNYEKDVSIKAITDSKLRCDTKSSVDLSEEKPRNDETSCTQIVRKATFTKQSQSHENREFHVLPTNKNNGCNEPLSIQCNLYSKPQNDIVDNDITLSSQSANKLVIKNGQKEKNDNSRSEASEKKLLVLRKDSYCKRDPTELETTKEPLDFQTEGRIISISSFESKQKPLIQKTFVPNTAKSHRTSEVVNNLTRSPFFNRKFNSVSPKRKTKFQTYSMIENKSLAASLDGQLDQQIAIIAQVKDDEDEGISSDNGSKNIFSSSHKIADQGPTRRSTFTKLKIRPKSEAFLDSLNREELPAEILRSNDSSNSISGSAGSLESERMKSSNPGKTIEDCEERKDNSSKVSENLKPSFAFIRGSDPRVATCRGKLQNKRSKLNQEINKELRLRAGAENLFKATTNRKLKETVALELSFVNSNLQLLKEQLAELNSSVELYQGDSPEPVMPMIPLGLKETKDIDFKEPFKDFILEHYSEDGANYEDAISELMDTRQAMRTPHRDASGVALLFQYYNQLYFVERRFFPPDRSLGIYFEWYDSLTGVPSCQRTVAFEKACVLFNIAALYTQLGAKQDRLTAKGLDQAVDNFLRAAGTFTYVHENFTNAPSMDLAPHMLDMLVQLMLAQARECLFEKLELQSRDKRDVDVSLDLAQEAAQVSEVYCTVQTLISVSAVRDYVPYSWLSLVQVKREHYGALAHYHSSSGLLAHDLESLSSRTKQTLHLLHRDTDHRTQLDISEPQDNHERKLLGRAHLRAALVMHEEAERLLRMCRELRSKQALTQVLNRCREATLVTYNNHTDKIDDFNDILDPPHIHASTKFQLSLTPPDFVQIKVEDLFKGLGPVAIFSAKHHWTAPRNVQLHRGDGEVGFGFSVRGDSPVIIAGVDQGSLAHFGGMKEGDFIVAIGDKDVKWAVHEEVVRLIKDAGDSLSLKLVTPMDRNYLKPKSSSQSSTQSSKSSGSSQPSPSNTASSHKKLTWNPFRRQRERETSFSLILR